MNKTSVHCECGHITGVSCAWDGPLADTVVLEWMPEHLRASHVAANNSGSYPHNGAERLRVEASCAEAILSDGSEWAAIVGQP